jgi:esterase/lipase superfamily enzyme
MTKPDFQTQLSTQLNSAAQKDVLIYVHGYNSSFADAVEATAILAADMKFPGVVALFSWPSAGAALDYFGDEDEVNSSRSNFVEFISAVRETPAVERLHALTHSMGGRLLTESVDWMSGRAEYNSRIFDHVVLAGPDIYAVRFKMALPSFLGLSKDVTLYASDNDEALVCSDRIAHGRPRAGQDGTNLLVLSNLNTVDVTPADPRTCRSFPCTPVGHSYITRNPAVLGDFQTLVVANLPAARRFRLIQKKQGLLDDWRFQP